MTGKYFTNPGEEGIVIDDTAAISIAEVRNRCVRLSGEQKSKWIFIDCLPLMRGSKCCDTRVGELQEIVREMRITGRKAYMSFIIAGDTHGMLDIGKVVNFFDGREDEFTEEDYLIICGDVGVCGFSASEEAKARSILRGLPVTTLFIDGNHENFEQLNSYGVEMWNGGKVHFIEDNIIHLMRGQVFCIDGIKFFTFGGAYSIDRMYRSEGISWFPEEIPSTEEYEEGWKNLEKADFQVDYILTHTGPREIAAEMGYGELADEEEELRKFLQRVADNTDFTAWYFGHFHEDTEVEEMFFCLYDEMVRL